jgi:16S rRNA (uracil1498-N3)-methyltransferase
LTAPRWCSTSPAVAHVFVDSLDDRIVLERADAHHLVRVRRLTVGETITTADGTGRWREYVVVAGRSSGLVAEASGPVEVEPELEPAITVAPALLKGGLDGVVAPVTELGAAAVVPLLTERTVARWDADRVDRALARLGRIARAAAEQSRRARIPRIDPPVDLVAVAAAPGAVVAALDGVPAADLGAAPDGGWTVVSGPEGGFSAAEAAALAGRPRLAVGPHVLRAETAPVAAVAALRGSRSGSPPEDPPEDPRPGSAPPGKSARR